MGHEVTTANNVANRSTRLRGWGIAVTLLPVAFGVVACGVLLRSSGIAWSSGQSGHLIAGAILLAGAGIQWWTVRKLVKHLDALSLIGQTLSAWSGGEPDAEALRITHNDQPATQGWNQLVEQMVQTQQQQTADHAKQNIAAHASQSAGQESTLDALPHGVIVVDPERNLVATNGAACRMLMRSRERLVGAPLDKITTDADLLALVDKTSTQTDSRGGGLEITLNPGEDQQAIVRATVRPLGERHNTPRSVVIVFEDVTQQRTADQSRNLFVAQATHELRTPLTNIGLYLERAIDLDDNATADRAECLNVINSEVLRLGRVVEEVLSVSEIEAGSHQIRRDDVRLDDLIGHLQSEYGPQAQEKAIQLEFDLPPKLPVVQGDREKISLALHNLLGNALKYTPENGSVKLAVQQTNSDIQIAVTDTGIGIAQSDLAKVFDKFYRADDQRLRDIKGSGLGLALAREVIRLHGGDITVESELDQGSTFTLRLPVGDTVSAAA